MAAPIAARNPRRDVSTSHLPGISSLVIITIRSRIIGLAGAGLTVGDTYPVDGRPHVATAGSGLSTRLRSRARTDWLTLGSCFFRGPPLFEGGNDCRSTGRAEFALRLLW